MKTLNIKTLAAASLTLAALLLSACSGSSGNSSSNNGLSAITVTPSPIIVAPSSSVLITPTGGTAPYTFVLANSTYGTVVINNGTYTVFQSLTALGAVTLSITDSVGLNVTVPVTVTNGSTATGTGTLTVTASTQTVTAGGTLSMTASGGTAPYTFAMVSGYTGSFSPATTATGTTTFVASTTLGLQYFTVSDSLGNTSTFQVTITSSGSGSGTSTTVSNCEGTYSFSYVIGTKTYSATMYLVSDASGNIAGYLYSGGYASIKGTCSAGAINFLNQYSGSTYTGTATYNSSSKIVMSGSFTGGTSSGTWTSTQQ